MGKRLPRSLQCSPSRRIHTVARQKRTDFWSPLIKKAPSAANTTEFLETAGFISKSHAGIYHFLPLGLRVLEKLESLVDKHMRSVGASKIALSSLSSQALWQSSGRLEAGGELFKFTDRSKKNWLLAPTHEEEVTQLLKIQHQNQYPNRIYQIGRKYRDERRPRGGLLRGKEFIMKDLYTFDETPEAAHATYDQVRAAYRNFFDDLGLPYVEARADSGSMGGNLSHEYHFLNEQGEDSVITCSSCNYARNVEFVSPIEPVVKEISMQNLPHTYQSKPGSVASRDFVSHDKQTLVRALVPSKESSGTKIPDVKARINTHALRAAVEREVDLATGIEEETALEFFEAARSLNSPESRRLVYVIDKRLRPDDLLARLHADQVPEDVKIWAVRSSSQDLSGPTSIDLLLPQTGDACPSCSKGKLNVRNAIEVGHTFHLGTRYSSKFNFKTQGGEFVEMGCHGVGISRLIAAAALPVQPSDTNKRLYLKWPKVIAPYQVCLMAKGRFEPAMHSVHDALNAKVDDHEKLDVLIDDRPGKPLAWKMVDAEHMGYPVMVLFEERTVESAACVKCPSLGIDEDVSYDDVPSFVRNLLQRL